MYQLVYLSRATRTLSVGDMERILIAARDRNQVAEVTGLLLFDGRRFIQALEGSEAEVVAIMHRIKADRRHRDIVYMPSSYVTERQFGSWSMHGRWLNDVDEAETFYRETSTLLKSVSNPEVLAAFLGFASMSRAPFRRAKSGTDTDADQTSVAPPID